MSIDDTQELAVRKARPYFEEHAKFMGPLGMLRYSEEHVKAVAERRPQSPTAATIENGVQNRTWLCGPAEEFIGYLKDVERRYPGLEHVMVSCPLGTPKKIMKENLHALRARGDAGLQIAGLRCPRRDLDPRVRAGLNARVVGPRARTEVPVAGCRSLSGACCA